MLRSFIEKANVKHQFKYDYSKVDYINCKIRICIICPKHGEFWVSPDKHIQGQGCPLCVQEEIRRKKFEKIIPQLQELYKGKYEYHFEDFFNIKDHVMLICPYHGPFKVTWEKHLHGYECPMCEKEIENFNRFQYFIDKAIEVHQGKYDYSLIHEIVLMEDDVSIICPIHGEFIQKATRHIQGQGCPKCAIDGKLSNTSEFIQKAKQLHGDIYDYSKVEYTKSCEKVCITCSIHGDFWMSPNNHLSGKGCPQCTGKYKTTEEFISQAEKIHNKRYDYSKVEYINATTKVCIICPKHGEFWQTPNKHLQGRGCSLCKQSHLENKVESMLIDNNFIFKKQMTFDWLCGKKLDFYLPQLNIAIECQGGQHFSEAHWSKIHGLEDDLDVRIDRDIEKYKLCQEHGIDILYFLERGISLDFAIDNQIFHGIYTLDNTTKSLTDLKEKLILN